MSYITPELTLWLCFAVLTGLVVWSLLSPFKAKRRAVTGEPDASQEVALYRDQLAEVTRDLERGVIGEAEAEAARIEVSRRLLAAVDAEKNKASLKPAVSPRRVAFAIMLFVPLLAVGCYLWLGSPDLPDAPLAARLDQSADNLPLDGLIVKVEQHLKEQPDDLQGWEVVAPAYMRQRNFPMAISAWNRVITLGGATAERLAARGEAQIYAADGTVTAGAKQDFLAAEKLDPLEPRAQYYLGLADIVDGHKEKAATRWQAMLDKAPKDALWRRSIETELANLSAPAPSQTQVDAAGEMTPEARTEMIRGMVANLAAKLDENPDDLSGWLRLIRAYSVLGDADAKAASVAKASKVFAAKPDALAEIDAAAKAPKPQ
ncbi:MAG: c-type cytochrome biogenesis protein CcmI [Parvibaculaceae bacterium]